MRQICTFALKRKRVHPRQRDEFDSRRTILSPYRACQVLSLLALKQNVQGEFGWDMSCGVKRQFCAALREVLDQTPQTESPGKANRSLYEYGVTRRLAAFRMVKTVHPKIVVLNFGG